MVHKKIAIIDDEEEMVQLLTVELESEGYQVVSATDGRAGLGMIKRERPDLIILDVMMPDVSGYEVIKALKQDGSLKNIPIIMLTAKSLDEDIQKGLDLGAQDYVTKPFHAGLLMKRIATVLHNGHTALDGNKSSA
jgi:DNA-binding response OmpR family regulator